MRTIAEWLGFRKSTRAIVIGLSLLKRHLERFCLSDYRENACIYLQPMIDIALRIFLALLIYLERGNHYIIHVLKLRLKFFSRHSPKQVSKFSFGTSLIEKDRMEYRHNMNIIEGILKFDAQLLDILIEHITPKEVFGK